MSRVTLGLPLDSGVVEAAQALGLNMLRLAEAAIFDATKAEQNKRWRTENQAAIAAYADEVARDGLPLAAFRMF